MTSFIAFLLVAGLCGPAVVPQSPVEGRQPPSAPQAPPAAIQAKQPPAAAAGQAAPKPGAQNPAKPDQKPKPKPVTPASVAPKVVPPAPPPPPGYVVGPDDVLVVLFWGEKEMSAEVVVRPDGMISLPLLNDVPAAGLTPDQLRDKVTVAARDFVQEPIVVTIVVKQINSRKVFVTGQVGKPGPYPLTGPTTVLQAIAMAGGLTEFAKQKDISIVRTEGGKTARFKFNYKDVMNGKNLKQNVELRPGDTVIVP